MAIAVMNLATRERKLNTFKRYSVKKNGKKFMKCSPPQRGETRVIGCEEQTSTNDRLQVGSSHLVEGSSEKLTGEEWLLSGYALTVMQLSP